MAARKLIGAIGIAGRVYRAGQEAEMEAAAAEHGVDLTRPRFAALFEGDEPVVVSAKSASALRIRAALDTAGVARGAQQTTAEVVFTPAAPKPRKPAPPKKASGTRSRAKKGK